jgi:hypothetical protein
MEFTQENFNALLKDKETLTAKVAQLEKNQSEQNSYITTLEKQVKDAKGNAQENNPANKGTSATPAAPILDPEIKSFMEITKKDMLTREIDKLVQEIGTSLEAEAPGHFALIKEEYKSFLVKNITKLEQATVAYATSALNLVYGKASRDVNHALYKALRNIQAPANQQTQPKGVPPVTRTGVMTNEDGSGVLGNPNQGIAPTKPKSTSEAWSRFGKK